MDFSIQAFSLEGRSAIVTGGAKMTGLNYKIAVALHKAGAKVAIIDASEQVLQTVSDLGGDANNYYGIAADLTKRKSLEAGFNEALSLLGGRVDILVNGAGMQYRCCAADFPEEAWDRVMDINIKAVFMMSQLAGREMIKNGYGKIINIGSTNSFIGLKNMPAYVASKGGVRQLTMALSTEWCGKGINVNAIAPGYMETEMSRDLQRSEAGAELTKRIPKGRWGKPEDLMGTVVFLASSASDYVSGVTIPVDGGHLAC